MQFSAESSSHPGVHQLKFGSWLGGIAKERADNGFRKGAAARTLTHAAIPLGNPYRRVILAASWSVEFTRLRVDALVDCTQIPSRSYVQFLRRRGR
jgi:hypothetical protein